VFGEIGTTIHRISHGSNIFEEHVLVRTHLHFLQKQVLSRRLAKQLLSEMDIPLVSCRCHANCGKPRENPNKT
jgi:hypothetical protein